ncbi:MAG: NfeD family protein [Actinomycetota bacterium]
MFIVVGIVGAALLIGSLLLDDLIDGLVPDLDFISGPVIGAGLAGFGLFGWFAQSGLDGNGVAALVAAVVGGVLVAFATYRLTRALLHQPTDATPTTDSLIGTSARVVTAITAGGIGEVIVTLGGATTKYTATSDRDLVVGTSAVVIGVESATKVRVEATDDFWT